MNNAKDDTSMNLPNTSTVKNNNMIKNRSISSSNGVTAVNSSMTTTSTSVSGNLALVSIKSNTATYASHVHSVPPTRTNAVSISSTNNDIGRIYNLQLHFTNFPKIILDHGRINVNLNKYSELLDGYIKSHKALIELHVNSFFRLDKTDGSFKILAQYFNHYAKSGFSPCGGICCQYRVLIQNVQSLMDPKRSGKMMNVKCIQSPHFVLKYALYYIIMKSDLQIPMNYNSEENVRTMNVIQPHLASHIFATYISQISDGNYTPNKNALLSFNSTGNYAITATMCALIPVVLFMGIVHIRFDSQVAPIVYDFNSIYTFDPYHDMLTTNLKSLMCTFFNTSETTVNPQRSNFMRLQLYSHHLRSMGYAINSLYTELASMISRILVYRCKSILQNNPNSSVITNIMDTAYIYPLTHGLGLCDRRQFIEDRVPHITSFKVWSSLFSADVVKLIGLAFSRIIKYSGDDNSYVSIFLSNVHNTAVRDVRLTKIPIIVSSNHTTILNTETVDWNSMIDDEEEDLNVLTDEDPDWKVLNEVLSNNAILPLPISRGAQNLTPINFPALTKK